MLQWATTWFLVSVLNAGTYGVYTTTIPVGTKSACEKKAQEKTEKHKIVREQTAYRSNALFYCEEGKMPYYKPLK